MASLAKGEAWACMQVEELAANMRPTGRFLHSATVVQMVEASIGIGLQGAREVCQVPVRMLALGDRASKQTIPRARAGSPAGRSSRT